MWAKRRQPHKLSYLRQFRRSTKNRSRLQQTLRICCEHMHINSEASDTHTHTHKSWCIPHFEQEETLHSMRRWKNDGIINVMKWVDHLPTSFLSLHRRINVRKMGPLVMEHAPALRGLFFRYRYGNKSYKRFSMRWAKDCKVNKLLCCSILRSCFTFG